MKIKSTVKTLEVENEKGKKTVYAFETGDPDVLENWEKKGKEIAKLPESMSESQYKAVYRMAGEFIEMVLGKKAWLKIEKDCNRSVYAVFSVFAEVCKLITAATEENARVFEVAKK